MAIEAQDIDMEEYNRRVSRWGLELEGKLRSSIGMLTSKGKGRLVKSLRLKTAEWSGEVDKLSYHFLRHGVFLHKGVGRGYVMQGGVVVRGQKPGKVLKAAAANAGRSIASKVLKLGEINRNAVEWFNPVVSGSIESLADMVTEMNADRVVSASKILIK